MEYKNLNYIKAGQIIRTQFNNSGEWYINIVIDNQKNFLCIPITADIIRESILPRDVIGIKYNIDQGYILMSCVVEAICFENPQFLNVRIVSQTENKNDRKSQRYDVQYICKLYQNDVSHAVYVVDLSAHGCKILSEKQLSMDIQYTLYIYYENQIIESEVLKLYGKIVRGCAYRNKFEYGIKFVNITEQEKVKVMTHACSSLYKEGIFLEQLKKIYKV